MFSKVFCIILVISTIPVISDSLVTGVCRRDYGEVRMDAWLPWRWFVVTVTSLGAERWRCEKVESEITSGRCHD
jgi:hypothetical protein